MSAIEALLPLIGWEMIQDCFAKNFFYFNKTDFYFKKIKLCTNLMKYENEMHFVKNTWDFLHFHDRSQ